MLNTLTQNDLQDAFKKYQKRWEVDYFEDSKPNVKFRPDGITSFGNYGRLFLGCHCSIIKGLRVTEIKAKY
jgi:hypothetical protein